MRYLLEKRLSQLIRIFDVKERLRALDFWFDEKINLFDGVEMNELRENIEGAGCRMSLPLI